ncbi:MAG: HlyD family efflux transporter periplasmic adaptor subunit, partial [Planctomycetales bacterium]|nr:HlyD family efflux transporter periplasmic adaptor subunit [Planctomycetales bacterium]
NSETNLEYTEITARVDGMVTNRLIDPGATLASQFQTPELFWIAPDMEKEMYVYASIDEMEIGDVKRAKDATLPVTFTVDAYPDDLFEGHIKQIRLSSTELQNVVTYPVVVSAANPEMKLLPGMTADLTFLIEEKKDVLRVPKAALRFYPERRDLVHEDDRDILDGAKKPDKSDQQEGRRRRRFDDEQVQDKPSSTTDQMERQKRRRNRHVWIQDGDFLRAIAVTIGLSDDNYSEILEGDLKDGQELVIAIDKK